MPKVNRRDHDAHVHQFLARLPRGPVWPRDCDRWLVKVVSGLTAVVHRFVDRAHDWVFSEAFPPWASELFTDHERWLGLPDKCIGQAATMAERRLRVTEKLANRPGRQDRDYFIGLAESIGYDIRIQEFAPFMAGVSEVGEVEADSGFPRWHIGDYRMRATWTIHVDGLRFEWFRCGEDGGQAGVDPHLRISGADDLLCLVSTRKPGHSKLFLAPLP